MSVSYSSCFRSRITLQSCSEGARSNVPEPMLKVAMGAAFVVSSPHALLSTYGGGEEDWKAYCRWHSRNEA